MESFEENQFRSIYLQFFYNFLNNISALLNLYFVGGGFALMITYFLAWHFNQKTDEVGVDNK
jgi:hypothetical protein